MGSNMADRRVRRTLRSLKESLLELMREKDFSEITVSDITERADVNRTTFYLHFENPAHLLQSIGDDLLHHLQELFDECQTELVGNKTIRPILAPALDFVTEHQELCTLLFDHEQESQIAEKLLVMIRENGLKILKAASGARDEIDISYPVAYITFGMIGILRTWLLRGMDLSKEEILQMAEDLTGGAVGFLIRP